MVICWEVNLFSLTENKLPKKTFHYSMDGLQKTLLFFFLVLVKTVFAQQVEKQSFSLSWKDQVVYNTAKGAQLVTSTVGGQTPDAYLHPRYVHSWEVAPAVVLTDYSLKDPVYEPFEPNRYIRGNEQIGKEPAMHVYFSKRGNRQYAHLVVMPVIKEGLVYKRLLSFDLLYTVEKSPVDALRSSTVKESVLASGSWFKFAVDTTGVYKLDYQFLKGLGLQIENANPAHIQLFGNGGAMLPVANEAARYDGLQENAIYVHGAADGRFDTADYILFYARGPHQWIKQAGSEGHNLLDYQHQLNLFSDKAYYFISLGNTAGKRIGPVSEIQAAATKQINTFHDHIFYEKEAVNLFHAGQQWFEKFGYEHLLSYSLPFDKVEPSAPLTMRVRAAVKSGLPSQIDVQVANQPVMTLPFSAASQYSPARAVSGTAEFQVSDGRVPVTVSFDNQGNPAAEAYLDYIEILGTKKLIADGKQFSFRNFEAAHTEETVVYSIAEQASIDGIWDVSDPLDPKNCQYQSAGGTVSLKASGGRLKEYVVLADDDYYLPEALENPVLGNQNLHSLRNIDYLIVTRSDLVAQAQRLADYHQTHSNLVTRVVPLHKIYNEFSSGVPDMTAIRDFIRHLYVHATTNPLKYVCFLGDASYDYKNKEKNLVPAFLSYESFNLSTSYVTDDFFAMMEDGEGKMQPFETLDVATGRIPVSSVAEADQVLTKLGLYSQEDAYGSWRTRVSLIADDIDASGEEFLQEGMEEIAGDIEEHKPLINIKKIFLDAYPQTATAGGNKYPAVNTEISNQVEKGSLLVNYFGHGGESGWAAESVLGFDEIASWNHVDRLPLFVTITCEFSRFDNHLRDTAGEALLLKKDGGAISLISTARQIYISFGQHFNKELVPKLLDFDNQDLPMAVHLKNTKNQFHSNQRYFIYFFGDPAMKLALPKPSVRLTHLNDISLSESLDTIKALSYVKMRGEVQDASGILLDDFSGPLSVTVFDKPVSKTTLDNDHQGIVMNFKVQESKIFNGQTSVKDGRFDFDFVAPRDLKIAYGNGKLSMYAHNNTTDRSGADRSLVIGGIDPQAPEDNTGPQIQLYMNDLNFVNGGPTNQSPLFLALLEDEHGINTSLSAIGHDIVAILDGDESNPIQLNDYYQTDLDTYQKGRVSYPLRNLSTGPHTIGLKAWDTYNNVSEASLSFTVVDDAGLHLTHVLNYPNPFVGHTAFWFQHNKPNEPLEVLVQVFTVSGKLVRTLRETVQTTGNLSRSVVWNGLDDFGAKVGKGVYVYKLTVRALYSRLKAEKTEKLVILQ